MATLGTHGITITVRPIVMIWLLLQLDVFLKRNFSGMCMKLDAVVTMRPGAVWH